MKAKKISAFVNFTIHSLRLPEAIQDPFQIEFKRGNAVGITEKKFIESENEVSFEKNFRCNITLIRSDDSSSDEYKKKKIAFTVFRYRNSSKKVYGKFTINAANYLKIKTDTIEVESPHSKKAYVVMTMGVTQTGVVNAQNDLDSQSEAIQLQTDHIDEWDVSDMVTPESRERIQNFFMKREAEKNEQRSRLSDFTRTSQQKETRKSRNRYQRRGSIDLLQIQTSLPTTIADAAQQAETEIKTTTPVNKAPKQYMSHSLSFNSNFVENDMQTKLSTNDAETKEPVKLDNFLAKKNKKRGIPLPAINGEKPHGHHGHRSHRSHHSHDSSSNISISSQISTSPDLMNDDEYENDTINDSNPERFNSSPVGDSFVNREIQIDDNTPFLQNILSKKWDRPPLDLSKYPNSASVIIATFAHTHFFENKSKKSFYGSELFDDFIQSYKSSVLLSSLSNPIDQWYVSSIISSSIFKLKDQLNFDNKKVSFFISVFSNIIIDQLYITLDTSFSPFEQAARTLIEGNLEDIEITKILNSSIQTFEKSLISKKLSKPITDFFVKTMITYFDRFLISTLLQIPEKCSFQNAAKWNTVITILYDSEIYRTHLKLFREAASAIMMSSILCEKPQMKNEFCPDLDVNVVYKILSIQKTDEFLPIPNDVESFKKYHNITQGNNEQMINLKDDRISFDIIYTNAIDTSAWNNPKISDEMYDEFPFFKNYFSK